MVFDILQNSSKYNKNTNKFYSKIHTISSKYIIFFGNHKKLNIFI